MAREKMPELKRKGNWKNAPGSSEKPKAKTAATKKRGVATTEAVKKMKREEKSVPSSAVRKKAAPDPKRSDAKSSQMKSRGKAASRKQVAKAESAMRKDARSSQSASVKADVKAKQGSSQKGRKKLDTGARSQNTSGTGYKEGSWMDRITRARRGTLKKKKKAPIPASRRKWSDQSA